MKATNSAYSLCLIVIFSLFADPLLFGQQTQREPRIGYVFPAGAQRGTTVEVTIGGQFLDDCSSVLLSGDGIKSTVVSYRKPLPFKRFGEFNYYIKEAREKAAASISPTEKPRRKTAAKNWNSKQVISEILKESGATDEEIAIFIQMQAERRDSKRQPNAQLVESVIIKLEIAPNAASGSRDLRLLTSRGITNPLVFCVGTLPETILAELDSQSVPVLTMPGVMNGRIMPGEVHRFCFEARRGAQMVFALQGRDLIPYLADAVPGWFQPVLKLFDEAGLEIAAADDFRFGPDPVLIYEAANPGKYTLEISDALYRGREDFIYRLWSGEIPFATGIFPMGGKIGEATTLEVSGVNLKDRTISLTPNGQPGIQLIPQLPQIFVSSGIPFAVDNLPETLELESKETGDVPTSVKLPIIINGRIQVPDDVDAFSFNCRAGEPVVVEVMSRRLQSPMDAWFSVSDPTGLQIAYVDDSEDKGQSYLTHHADPRMMFKPLVDGKYTVRIGDLQKKGGSSYAYRLRLSPPRPDFALRVVPSSIYTHPGARVPVTFHVLRLDGFSGDIKIEGSGLPEGLLLEGGIIPAGSSSVQTTLMMPANMPEVPMTIHFLGNATIADELVTRPVVPADDMLQAFIYHHLVPSREMCLMTKGKKTYPLKFISKAEEPLLMKEGSQTQVVFKTSGRLQVRPEELRCNIMNSIEGISVGAVTSNEGELRVDLVSEKGKKYAVRSGNLILEIYSEKPLPDKDGKKGGAFRTSLGLLPALPFQIMSPES